MVGSPRTRREAGNARLVPMRRLPIIIVIGAGSWLAGMLGAFLVWNFIYSIGSGVVDDATYGRLHGEVVRGGGYAGAGLAVWVGLVGRRRSMVFLGLAHLASTIAGFIAGAVDCKAGLWGYFGVLGLFAVLAPNRKGRRSGGRGRVTDGSGGGWDDGGDGGDGWSGSDGGCDGGGGDSGGGGD
jgi:hypothetical protein